MASGRSRLRVAMRALLKTRGRTRRRIRRRSARPIDERHRVHLPLEPREGQRCVVLARGTLNSYLVRFEDRDVMVTSRNALRRAA